MQPHLPREGPPCSPQSEPSSAPTHHPVQHFRSSGKADSCFPSRPTVKEPGFTKCFISGGCSGRRPKPLWAWKSTIATVFLFLTERITNPWPWTVIRTSATDLEKATLLASVGMYVGQDRVSVWLSGWTWVSVNQLVISIHKSSLSKETLFFLSPSTWSTSLVLDIMEKDLGSGK